MKSNNTDPRSKSSATRRMVAGAALAGTLATAGVGTLFNMSNSVDGAPRPIGTTPELVQAEFKPTISTTTTTEPQAEVGMATQVVRGDNGVEVQVDPASGNPLAPVAVGTPAVQEREPEQLNHKPQDPSHVDVNLNPPAHVDK
jgi:hypothetical protein